MRTPSRQRTQREPTIALINIVFLMLVFFMVAGTLSQPLDKDLTLVQTGDLEGRAPPDALVIHPDGRLAYRRATVESATAFVATLETEARTTLRIVPDRALPAQTIIRITRALRDAGADKVVLVTQRTLQ